MRRDSNLSLSIRLCSRCEWSRVRSRRAFWICFAAEWSSIPVSERARLQVRTPPGECSVYVTSWQVRHTCPSYLSTLHTCAVGRRSCWWVWRPALYSCGTELRRLTTQYEELKNWQSAYSQGTNTRLQLPFLPTVPVNGGGGALDPLLLCRPPCLSNFQPPPTALNAENVLLWCKRFTVTILTLQYS